MPRSLLRQAQTKRVRTFAEWYGADKIATAHAIAERTTMFATVPGVTSLTFRDAKDLDQLVISNGAWRIDDGRLLGACRGTDNYATHTVAFATVRSVVLRGGIRSPDGLNFRCKVGDVNLLLNWEVRDENHLWIGEQCQAKGPPALQVLSAARSSCARS